MIVRELIAKIGFKLDKGSERQVKLSFKNFKTGLQNLDKSLNKTSGIMGKLFTGLALAGIGRSLIKTISEFQQLEAQLVTIEGSFEKAAKEFAKLQEFAKKTPFQLGNIVKAYATLRGAGLEPTTEEMGVMGDMAAGMGQDITDVSEAFAKASLGNFELLRERLKIAVTQSKGEVTLAFGDFKKTVKKDGKEVREALLELGRIKFEKGMKRQLQTLAGQFSNLQDNLAAFAKEVGEAGLSKALLGLNDFFKELTKEAGERGLAKVLGRQLAAALDLVKHGLVLLKKHGDLLIPVLKALVVLEVAKWLLGIAASISVMKKEVAIVYAHVFGFIALLFVLEDLIRFFLGHKSVIGGLIDQAGLNSAIGLFGLLTKVIVGTIDVFTDFLALVIDKGSGLIIAIAAELSKGFDLISDGLVWIVNQFIWFINTLEQGFGMISGVFVWIVEQFMWFINTLTEGFGIILSAFSNFLSRLKNVVRKIPGGSKLLNIGAKVVGAAGDAAGGVADFVTGGGAVPATGELGGRQMASSTTVNTPITVNPAPGMDEEKMARMTANYVKAEQSDATKREMRAQFRNAAEDRRGGVT